MSTECASLSFTVRRATVLPDLLDVCKIRSEAYGHHLPDLSDKFLQPDALDTKFGTVVLLCRDKLTGAPVGTARLQFSDYGPLQIDQSLALPAQLSSNTRAEITRLAVAVGADASVKLALMKACYQLCMAQNTKYLVIGARCAALIRNYRRLGFADVLGENVMISLAHAGGLLHRVLSFDVAGAVQAWRLSRHPLLNFMVNTDHVDIDVGLMAVRPFVRAA